MGEISFLLECYGMGEISLNLEPTARVYDRFGNRSPVIGSGGVVQISLSKDPIYVTGKKYDIGNIAF